MSGMGVGVDEWRVGGMEGGCLVGGLEGGWDWRCWLRVGILRVCSASCTEWLGLNLRECVWEGMSDGIHTRMLKYGIILRVCSANCTEWLGLFGESVFGEKSLTVYIHVC